MKSPPSKFVVAALFAGALGLAFTPIVYAAEPFLEEEIIFPLEKWHNHGSCIVEAPNGDLIVCGSLGDLICVFNRSGVLKDRYDTGEHTKPTNCCIGDGLLYVTYAGTGQLVAFDWTEAALPLHPFRS